MARFVAAAAAVSSVLLAVFLGLRASGALEAIEDSTLLGQYVAATGPWGSVVLVLLMATVLGLLPTSFPLAHFGSVLTANSPIQVGSTVLALGLFLAVPLAYRLSQRRTRPAPDRALAGPSRDAP